MLLESGDRPTAYGVEITFLVGEHFVENLVDLHRHCTHGRRFSIRGEYLGVAGASGHSGADPARTRLTQQR